MGIGEKLGRSYIGLYVCLVLTLLAAEYPLELFESYSLIDARGIRSMTQELARRSGPQGPKAGTFGMDIGKKVVYELPMPKENSGEIRIVGDPLMTPDKYAFQLSTSRGLIDVLVTSRDRGGFSLSFSRSFERKAFGSYPWLWLLHARAVTLALCAILFLRLLPIYSFTLPGGAGKPSFRDIENNIIGLPFFVMCLTWFAGAARLAVNLAGCHAVLGELPAPTVALFAVSFVMHIALTSLLTMGFTQEYVNRYIAAPIFGAHDPHGMRSGRAMSLSARFFVIIFAVGMAPTALGLYLPLSFNVGLFADLASLSDVLGRFEVLVPVLITFFFAIYFFLMQIASFYSFRRNIILPVNKLIERMKLVAKGDLSCKTSVLGVDEIGQLKGHFNSMLDGLNEREKIRDAFGRFMSVEIAEKLLHEKKIALAGEEIEATVMFCDIRDFTPLSEKMNPAGLVEFLNLYFSHIVKPIRDNGGVVNKFIGDAIMAVFAPSLGTEDHANAAVAAALGMRNSLAKLNSLAKYPAVSFGVGMHSGRLVAGNIGTEDRMEYTFIGDNVNIAARIESQTKTLGADILASGDMIARIDRARFPQVAFKNRGPVLMKGKSVSLELYSFEAGEKR